MLENDTHSRWLRITLLTVTVTIVGLHGAIAGAAMNLETPADILVAWPGL